MEKNRQPYIQPQIDKIKLLIEFAIRKGDMQIRTEWDLKEDTIDLLKANAYDVERNSNGFPEYIISWRLVPTHI